MKKIIAIIMSVLLLLTMGACAISGGNSDDDDKPAKEEYPLAGTEWVLTSVESNGVELSGSDIVEFGMESTLTFKEKAATIDMMGQTGTSAYTFDGTTVTITDLDGTVTIAELDGDVLTIEQDGVYMHFTNADVVDSSFFEKEEDEYPLADTEWILTGAETEGVLFSREELADLGMEGVLSFSEKYASIDIMGETGTSEYVFDGTTVTITDADGTVTIAELDGNVITIVQDGVAMYFTNSDAVGDLNTGTDNSLAGTEWVLSAAEMDGTVLNQTDLADIGMDGDLIFTDSFATMYLSGESGTSMYSFDGTTVTITDLDGTVTIATVDGDELVIVTDGVSLIFTKQ